MGLAFTLIISGLLFLCILISLGFQPKIISKVLGLLFLCTGIAGILLYGYGFFTIYGFTPIAIMRTLFSVFCMFLGRNEISAIASTPLISMQPVLVLLYLIHLVALYTTASSVIAGIGTRLIRTLNLMLIHRKDINLIYGANDDSVSFGQKLSEDNSGIVVFVDKKSKDDYSSTIMHMGSILFNDENATSASVAFLKKIGLWSGKKKVNVYCLDENTTENLRFAQNLKESLEKAGLPPRFSTITMLAPDGAVAGSLQNVKGGKYGFGNVIALEKPELIARMLVRSYPPYETMRFKGNAVADEDFEVIVIGFGRTGQAVLRHLLMNGQFEGSRFKATIIADKYSVLSGSFFHKYPGILKNYDINVMETNARSIEFYEFLSKCFKTLNYVAVCTGSDSENNEITKDISDLLRKGGSKARVVQCSENGLNIFSDEDRLPVSTDLYTPDILCGNKLDELAMIINHSYHVSEGNTVEEDWAACDYFSRRSCRAAADYYPALITSAGITREQLLEEGWPDNKVLLENLAKAEHLRWNAFHFANGYQTMPKEMFESRAAVYKNDLEENGSTNVRIGKDTFNRYHACLVSWDELDTLSERENSYTGKNTDYKEMDRDNIRMIPEMIKKEQERA